MRFKSYGIVCHQARQPLHLPRGGLVDARPDGGAGPADGAAAHHPARPGGSAQRREGRRRRRAAEACTHHSADGGGDGFAGTTWDLQCVI